VHPKGSKHHPVRHGHNKPSRHKDYTATAAGHRLVAQPAVEHEVASVRDVLWFRHKLV
jgi:hypothetical protein